MQTRQVSDVVPANNFSVARISRELPNRSSIGLIGVNRQSSSNFLSYSDYNRTFGADVNLGLGEFANLFNYIAKTKTPGLQNSDHAYSSRLDYDDSTHEFILAYMEVGRNFNPEAGFVRRTNFRKPEYFYRYTYYPDSKIIRDFAPHFSRKTWYQLQTNNKESDFQHYHIDSHWQNGGRSGIAFNHSFERLDQPFEIIPGITVPSGQYGFNEIIANIQTDGSARIFAGGNVAAGGFYNGNIRSINLNGGYRQNQNLSWTTSYVHNSIKLPVGNFNTDLIGLRFNWSFNSKSFFQTLSQYNNLSKSFGHNIRLGLMTTSSTGFFVVFNTPFSVFNPFVCFVC